MAGKRYLTFNCFLATPTNELSNEMERLARNVSLGNRFSIDLAEIGRRQDGKPICVSGYVFRNSCGPDGSYHLESIQESEIKDVLEAMNVMPEVVSYAATEMMTTESRGCPTKGREFKIRK